MKECDFCGKKFKQHPKYFQMTCHCDAWICPKCYDEGNGIDITDEKHFSPCRFCDHEPKTKYYDATYDDESNLYVPYEKRIKWYIKNKKA